MVEKPVKCIHCGTWNLPEAKFCRTCGDDLEPHRRLQEIEDELEMREKILQEWGVSDDDDQQLSQKPEGGLYIGYSITYFGNRTRFSFNLNTQSYARY